MTAEPAPAAAPVDVQGLTKAFGPRQVLRGLDLRVGAGQLVGLVGPNGAGKSTLLRTLLGLCGRDAGRVAVLGLDPARESLPIRRRTTYLPGETSVYANMTGRQFVDFALAFYPARQDALQTRLLDLFELPLRRKVRTYSAGMKQKLAILVTLVPDVELYVLDEPDRALDASVRFRLRAVLAAMRDEGRTLLLSSHHLAEVETLADRLEFLLDGRMVSPAVVEAARDRLRRRVRLRLADGVAPPADCRVLDREHDGTLVLEAPDQPMRSLRALPDGSFAALELGVARLEDLYQLLIDGDGDAAARRDAAAAAAEARP